MEPTRILIVATSHEQLGDTGHKTGLWLEELVVPFYLFKDAGVIITLATPAGGEVPLDPKSESVIASNSTIRRFKKDTAAMHVLWHTLPLDTQKAGDFDLVFLIGGHGAMWDFPGSEPLKQILDDFIRQHKLIGAVCHGVAGLVSLETAPGEPFVKGRRLAGFSNSEEQVAGLTDIVPFLLESKLVSLGASYSKGKDFVSHTVIDGNLITGQNPASAADVARELLASLKALPKTAGLATV